ncbi:type VI secretion system ATPase TssH [Endozoicomonas sp. GU-1]|uniref:type VI secretion system ATPase TssH n=1 Tax=Endozoicomonas sp. GU-1 TaxID=3009078 RepID=UPI0022B5524A|nr:type VI secretion system ATPase TssH [Endozoicomonas sp. GU-1]WBA83888.1 type VI secretion system ATPase TssH [Endozoicomonas sp. GU-1]WBA86866.1 type VI secretion system ATPase TssH [Endozoicomonas sp. GU-1]
MQQVELKTLVGHLSPELRQALEMAAGLCVHRGHQTVEPEHWLLQLFREPGRDMERIIHSQQLTREVMVDDLEQLLDRLNTGYQATPALAQTTVSLIQDTWLLASVNFQQNTMTAYHLILALLAKESFTLTETPFTRELGKISREKLQSLARQPEVPDKQGGAPPGSQSALDKYTINMTDAARAVLEESGSLSNRSPTIIGRDREIRQIIDILCRHRQNNPILVGDAGVGKTAVVEGLAQQVVLGDVPETMQGVAILSLDLGLLQAGASIKGEFENRLKDVINEVKQSDHPIVVFIDEAHTLVGAGGAAGQNDAANLLKPALARGEFKTIAATTWSEYKQYFDKDAALARRFQPVKILEPDETSAIRMTRGMARLLEKHHQVRIHEDAVQAAVQLSIRYLPERQLPDKAISLLDTACSRVSLSRHTTPAELQHLRQHQQALTSELRELQRDRVTGAAVAERIALLEEEIATAKTEGEVLEQRWRQEQEIVAKMLPLSARVDQQLLTNEVPVATEELNQLSTLQQELEACRQNWPLVFARVDAGSVAEVVSGWTGIPAGDMLRDEIERLMLLEQNLCQRVVGQDDAISGISQSVRIGRAGLSDPRKPVGVFLMCGPSGVGKTETALALADQLYGGEQNLTVLNMTEFKEEHKVSMLLGAPAGYVGYGEGGVLTEAVRRCPYSVLLLDEMEKAHPGVHDIFYQVFDKGRVTDSEGREVNFCQTIIIMTSNAADGVICDLVAQFQRQGKGIPDRDTILAAINDELLRYFKPAFLGRVTIIPYLPLSEPDLTRICRLALGRIEHNLASRYGASLRVDDAVVQQLVQWHSNPKIGARAIEQQINRNLMPQLAAECLAFMAEGKRIASVAVGLDHQRIVYTIG